MPVWSEAAPPAPLRGHFLFCLPDRKSEKRDRRTGIPDDDVVADQARDEAALIGAKAPRCDQAAGREIEDVSVHRTRHAIALPLAFTEACARVVAGVFDGVRLAVHECDQDVKRRVVQPSQRAPREALSRNPTHEDGLRAHRPSPSAA